MALVSVAFDRRSVQVAATAAISSDSFKAKPVFDEIEKELQRVSDYQYSIVLSYSAKL